MKFLHISDLHYRKNYPEKDEGYLSIFKDMTSPELWLKKSMERFRKECPSFIIISGDLTENGTEEDYRALKALLDEQFGEIPYVVTLGNHDNRQAFRQAWLGKAELREDETPYGTVRVFDNVMVIALDNSSDLCQDGMITENHCLWLERCLKEAESDGQTAILMMHHPLVFDPVVAIPVVTYPECFPAILERYSPAAILCGHTHHPVSGMFGHVFYATAGSMSFRGYSNGDGSICFREYASVNLVRLEKRFLAVETILVRDHGRVLGTVKM